MKMTNSQQKALNAILDFLILREEIEVISKTLIVNTKNDQGEYQTFTISPRGKTVLFGLVPAWYNDTQEDIKFNVNHIKKMLKFQNVNMYVGQMIKDKLNNKI